MDDLGVPLFQETIVPIDLCWRFSKKKNIVPKSWVMMVMWKKRWTFTKPCSSTGHNGAGKTTLMKEIAARRIVGMPPDRGMDVRDEWDIVVSIG